MSEEQFHPGAHVAEHGDKPAYVMAATGEVVTYRELARAGQPPRPPVPEPGPAARRPRGLLPGEPPVVPGHRLGRPLRRALLHGHLAPGSPPRRSATSSTTAGPGCSSRRPTRPTRPPSWWTTRPGWSTGSCSTARVDGYELLRGRRRRPARRRPGRGPSRAWTCSTPRAPRAGPRASRWPLPRRPARHPRRRCTRWSAGLFGGQRRHRVPLPRPAVPRRPAALLPWPVHRARRHRRGDGALRPGARPSRLIERHRVTHSQCRAHHVRPHAEAARGGPRAATTCRSLQVAVHAAAPCPVTVKEQMIEWWGPVIHEYYAGTEGNGFVLLRTARTGWPTRARSAGRSSARCTSSTSDGEEVRAGEAGTVYFERRRRVRLPQRPRQDRGVRDPRDGAGRRSATSATSTRTASST